MRLSYSRLDYYQVVFDQKVDTWLQCHINAFKYFGGVAKVIKLDNLKAGIINANFYEPQYQQVYKNMADYYGTLITPCRTYQPQEKGKVESGVKYVKNNFFLGRKFSDNRDLNEQLCQWLDKANARIHGTTHKQPIEVFKSEEKEELIPLPLEEFVILIPSVRKVAKDCHIIFDNNYYSVPSKYVSKEVKVVCGNNLVKIYAEDVVVATHERSKSKGEFKTNISHFDQYKRLCPGFAEYDIKYEDKMKAIGPFAEAMLKEMQKEYKNNWHRPVRGVIDLCKLYEHQVVDKACKRALSFGICSYSKIKSIIENNCYELPVADFGGDYAITN
jgi:hypothetical protein